jgi:uncharacterized membrane protein HdeD (DUF308 family)
MFDLSARRSSLTLHVALGLILAVEGALTMIHALSAHEDLHLLAFAAIEVIGALLFIWARTMRIGACVLVCAFIIAAVVHLLRGEFPSEHLVYAVAVLFVMIHSGGWRSLSGHAAA